MSNNQNADFKIVACPVCFGSGTIRTSARKSHRCYTCSGRGSVSVTAPIPNVVENKEERFVPVNIDALYKLIPNDIIETARTFAKHNPDTDIQTAHALGILQGRQRPATPTAEDGWVSVSDRLPENEQNVLVAKFIVDRYDIMLMSAQFFQEYYNRTKCFVLYGDALPCHTITHWMPLPTPPTK